MLFNHEALSASSASAPGPFSEAAVKTVPRVGGEMPLGRRPDWFHVPAPGGKDSNFAMLQSSVRDLKLATVCEEVPELTTLRCLEYPLFLKQARLIVGAVPEHRRVLERRHGHDHGARRHVHAGLPLLRRQDG